MNLKVVYIFCLATLLVAAIPGVNGDLQDDVNLLGENAVRLQDDINRLGQNAVVMQEQLRQTNATANKALVLSNEAAANTREILEILKNPQGTIISQPTVSQQPVETAVVQTTPCSASCCELAQQTAQQALTETQEAKGMASNAYNVGVIANQRLDEHEQYHVEAYLPYGFVASTRDGVHHIVGPACPPPMHGDYV